MNPIVAAIVRDPLKQAFACALFVLVCGPLIGAALVGVPLSVLAAVTDRDGAGSALSHAGVILAGALNFAVIFGGLPAVVSSAATGILVSRGTVPGYTGAAGIGAAAALTESFFFGLSLVDDAPVTASLAALCGFCAVICRWLMAQIGLLPAAGWWAAPPVRQ